VSTFSSSPVNQNDLVVTEQQVTQFLLSNPDFLQRHPDVLADLLPPRRSDIAGAADFQQYQIETLQHKLANMRSQQSDFFNTARDNLLTQQKIHECVLLALDAEGSADLLDVVLTDWPQVLEMAAINFCLEKAPSGHAWFEDSMIVSMEPGTINRLIGHKHNVLLRPLVQGEKLIFGAAALGVRSDALIKVRLDYTTPVGMLAFGAPQPGSFAPGQSVELLVFLARAFEASLRLWKFLEN
jgi:uncharacterized protein YigA (DUF484 family)